MSQMKKIHQNFYSHTNKKDQDAILLKLCTIMSANRNSKNQHKYKFKKQTTIKYGVIVNKTKIPICNKFFLHIFGITKHRVAFVMKKFYYTGEVGTEHRGGDRKTAKFADQKQSIHNYIATLQCIESHYCRRTKTAERKYLPSELSLSKLFKMYKVSEHVHPLVKLSYFRHVFNTSYNIGFGTPKTDVCSTCLELKEKIKIEIDPIKKNLLMIKKRVHSLRAKAFFEKLGSAPEGVKIISFDCQKNLPLPKLPDQSTYYSRQLYYYNLTMVEGTSSGALSKDNVFAYCCTENEYNKNSNLIASAVYHRLTATDKTDIKHIRLIADGCGGQNKNCIVLGACSKWLLENPSIHTIELVFPVTGHSFMPADRQFGVIERKLKKMEVILHPNEITEIITECSSIVKFGSDCIVRDWRDSVRKVLKQTTSWSVQFKECKRFILKRSKKAGNVLIRGELNYKTDLGKFENVCQRNKQISMLNPQPLANIVPVNKNKLQDVKKLLQKHFGPEWVDLQSLIFYKDLFQIQEELVVPQNEESFCSEAIAETIDLHV